MKSYLLNLFVVLSILSTTGCVYSYNQQRSSARSAGDMGMTAIVDKVDPQSKEQLAAYTAFIDEIIAFLNSGKVGNMTQEQLVVALNKIVPVQYSNYTASLVGVIGTLNIPVDSVLPEKAVVLLKDFANGSKTAVVSYTLGKNVVVK